MIYVGLLHDLYIVIKFHVKGGINPAEEYQRWMDLQSKLEYAEERLKTHSASLKQSMDIIKEAGELEIARKDWESMFR
jgi:hypothetical protein